jgi:hypothetical protein
MEFAMLVLYAFFMNYWKYSEEKNIHRCVDKLIPEHLNSVCVAYVIDQAAYFETWKYSLTLRNFQTSKSFNILEMEDTLLMTSHRNVCKPTATTGLVSSEPNNICVTKASDQSAKKYYQNISTETEDPGSET